MKGQRAPNAPPLHSKYVRRTGAACRLGLAPPSLPWRSSLLPPSPLLLVSLLPHQLSPLPPACLTIKPLSRPAGFSSSIRTMELTTTVRVARADGAHRFARPDTVSGNKQPADLRTLTRGTVDTTSPYPQPTWVHPSAGGYPCPPTTASNPYGEQLQQQHQDPYQQQHAPPPPSGSQQPGAWSSGQYGSTPGHDQYSSGNTTGQLATGYTAPPQQLGQQQDLYYTDATRTTTDTTDRGFGKVCLTPPPSDSAASAEVP